MSCCCNDGYREDYFSQRESMIRLADENARLKRMLDSARQDTRDANAKTADAHMVIDKMLNATKNGRIFTLAVMDPMTRKREEGFSRELTKNVVRQLTNEIVMKGEELGAMQRELHLLRHEFLAQSKSLPFNSDGSLKLRWDVMGEIDRLHIRVRELEKENDELKGREAARSFSPFG